MPSLVGEDDRMKAAAGFSLVVVVPWPRRRPASYPIAAHMEHNAKLRPIGVQSTLPEGDCALSLSLCVIRSCKIALVSAIALFFTAVVADNLTDYGSNWQFVQHVLSMDTTFPNSKLHWRAITDSVIQQAVYWLIIATQFATAALSPPLIMRTSARRKERIRMRRNLSETNAGGPGGVCLLLSG